MIQILEEEEHRHLEPEEPLAKTQVAPHFDCHHPHPEQRTFQHPVTKVEAFSKKNIHRENISQNPNWISITLGAFLPAPSLAQSPARGRVDQQSRRAPWNHKKTMWNQFSKQDSTHWDMCPPPPPALSPITASMNSFLDIILSFVTLLIFNITCLAGTEEAVV